MLKDSHVSAMVDNSGQAEKKLSNCPAEKPCPDKLCGANGEMQPLAAFPLNRRRSDGRHLYCKACSNRRVHEGRVRKRQRRAARKKIEQEKKDRQMEMIGVSPSAAGPPHKLHRDDRVWIAIAKGARTQREIKLAARVGTKDEVGLSLVELILNRGWVRSELTADRTERVYFPCVPTDILSNPKSSRAATQTSPARVVS